MIRDAQQELEDNAEISQVLKCCPDCDDVLKGNFKNGKPIHFCANAGCACHRPLSVVVNDDSVVIAKFGG